MHASLREGHRIRTEPEDRPVETEMSTPIAVHGLTTCRPIVHRR